MARLHIIDLTNAPFKPWSASPGAGQGETKQTAAASCKEQGLRTQPAEGDWPSRNDGHCQGASQASRASRSPVTAACWAPSSSEPIATSPSGLRALYSGDKPRQTLAGHKPCVCPTTALKHLNSEQASNEIGCLCQPLPSCTGPPRGVSGVDPPSFL
ncbi:hypothetical protein MN608_07008 [Microdochium nivale]|nr:hypothetical protein MN608_07008 [Microdochium nivale]